MDGNFGQSIAFNGGSSSSSGKGAHNWEQSAVAFFGGAKAAAKARNVDTKARKQLAIMDGCAEDGTEDDPPPGGGKATGRGNGTAADTQPLPTQRRKHYPSK